MTRFNRNLAMNISKFESIILAGCPCDCDCDGDSGNPSVIARTAELDSVKHTLAIISVKPSA